MNTTNTLNTTDNTDLIFADTFIVAHHDGGQMFAGDDTYYQRGWYVYGLDGFAATPVNVLHPRLEELAGDICVAMEQLLLPVVYHEGGAIWLDDDTEFPAGWYLFGDDDELVPVTVYYPGSNDPVDGANILY